MTYTKRQKFIYRFTQVLNMLGKSINYMTEVKEYLKDSKYYKRANKILKNISNQFIKSEKLLDEVDKK